MSRAALLLLALAGCVPAPRTVSASPTPRPSHSTPAPPGAVTSTSLLLDQPLPRDERWSAHRIDAVPGQPISTDHPKGTLFLALWLQHPEASQTGPRLIEWDLARSEPLRTARIRGSAATEIRLVGRDGTWHLLVQEEATVQLVELDATWTVRGAIHLPIDDELRGLQLAVDAEHVVVAGERGDAAEGPSMRVIVFGRRDGIVSGQRDFWGPAADRSHSRRAIVLRDGLVFVAAQQDEGSRASGSSMVRGPRGPLVVYRFPPSDPARITRAVVPGGASFDFASLGAIREGVAVFTPTRCTLLDTTLTIRGTCGAAERRATPRALGLRDESPLSLPCLPIDAFGARYHVCTVQRSSTPAALRVIPGENE